MSSNLGSAVGEQQHDAEGVLRADESARVVLHILGGKEALEDAVVSGE